MCSGGVGTRQHFLLDWDKLIVILTLNGLSADIRIKLLKKFDHTEVTVPELSQFLDTLSTSRYLKSGAGSGSINKIERGKGKDKKQPNNPNSGVTAIVSSEACSRCNSVNPRHLALLKGNGNKCEAPQFSFCKKKCP